MTVRVLFLVPATAYKICSPLILSATSSQIINASISSVRGENYAKLLTMVACLADKNTLHWVLALGRLNAVCTSKANLNNYDTQIGKWPLKEYSTNEQGSTV